MQAGKLKSSMAKQHNVLSLAKSVVRPQSKSISFSRLKERIPREKPR